MGNNTIGKCNFNMAGKEEEPHLCGRKSRGGESGYCIFHAPVGEKGEEEFWDGFWDYVDEVKKELSGLKDPGGQRRTITFGGELNAEVYLDCRAFEFPETSNAFVNFEFPMPVTFRRAKFKGKANFNAAVFRDFVSFGDSVFEGDADFSQAKFQSSFDGYRITFNNNVVFEFAEFQEMAFFTGTNFVEEVNFERSKFLQWVVFGSVTFGGDSKFGSSEFHDQVDFSYTRFISAASFNSAQFRNIAHFHGIGVGTKVEFYNAFFEKSASFITVIKDDERVMDWRFIDRAYPSEITPALVNFANVNTGINARLNFEKSDLGDWAFFDTPGIIDGVFRSVTWKSSKPKKRHITRDEKLAKEGEIPLEASIEVYRVLRKNFEERLSYGSAGYFHISEMEMRRFELRQKRWKRFFNLTWLFLHLYRIFGGYGERIRNPIISFIAVGLAFAGLWSVIGFPVPEGEGVRITHNFGYAILFSFKTFLTLPGKALCLVQELVGAFQRAAGVGIITLFILALRRAFRR